MDVGVLRGACSVRMETCSAPCRSFCRAVVWKQPGPPAETHPPSYKLPTRRANQNRLRRRAGDHSLNRRPTTEFFRVCCLISLQPWSEDHRLPHWRPGHAASPALSALPAWVPDSFSHHAAKPCSVCAAESGLGCPRRPLEREANSPSDGHGRLPCPPPGNTRAHSPAKCS